MGKYFVKELLIGCKYLNKPRIAIYINYYSFVDID